MLGTVQRHNRDHVNNYSLQNAAGQSSKLYLLLLSLLLHMKPLFLWITFLSACMNSGQCPELYHLHHVQVPALTDRVTEDMCKPSQLATLAQKPAVFLFNSTVVCNHERLTWSAEWSLWVLNIVYTQTKISFILYIFLKSVFFFLWCVHNTHIYTCKGANPIHISRMQASWA